MKSSLTGTRPERGRAEPHGLTGRDLPAADAVILEAGGAHLLRPVDVAQIDDERPVEELPHPPEVEGAERVPFGDQDQRVGAFHGFVGIGAVVDLGISLFASAMPSGSKARTLAPAAASAGRIDRLGLSRMSSVLGLKVSPKAAMVRPSTPPQIRSMRSAIRRFLASLTLSTVSTIWNGASASSAVRTRAWQSFGKHEPPKPGPACRNFLPMRPSKPMPRATS